jgi:hypothetical protein
VVSAATGVWGNAVYDLLKYGVQDGVNSQQPTATVSNEGKKPRSDGGDGDGDQLRLTRYDHPSGEFSLQYPSHLLGVEVLEMKDNRMVLVGNCPRKGNSSSVLARWVLKGERACMRFVVFTPSRQYAPGPGLNAALERLVSVREHFPVPVFGSEFKLVSTRKTESSLETEGVYENWIDSDFTYYIMASAYVKNGRMHAGWSVATRSDWGLHRDDYRTSIGSLSSNTRQCVDPIPRQNYRIGLSESSE